MSRTRTRTRPQNDLEPADHGRLLAAGSVRPGQSAVYTTIQLNEKPAETAFNSIIERCKYYDRESEWLGMYLRLRLSIFNYGLELVPGSFDTEETTDPTALTQWLNQISPPKADSVTPEGSRDQVQVESTSTNRQEVTKFIKAAWRNWNLFDNLAGFWRDGADYPLILPLERTTYANVLGIETLKYRHGLSQAQIALLTPEDQGRFTKSEINIDAGAGEHFKVLTRQDEGSGYGVPRLFSVITLLAQEESQACGLHSLAFALRSVKRHHKIGHKIETGPHSGKPQHFWSKKRHAAIMKSFDRKTGFADFTSNFDHEIEFPWPDVANFDETLFKGSSARLMRWGGPVARMMMMETAAPMMTQLLRAEASEERDSLKEWLEAVINLAFKPPVPIGIKWSNMIFNTDRLHEELLKFSFDRGLASSETTRDLIGLDHESENEKKRIEADDPDAKKLYTPIWDDSHGSSPALGESSFDSASAKSMEGGGDSKNTPGRKPGE